MDGFKQPFRMLVIGSKSKTLPRWAFLSSNHRMSEVERDPPIRIINSNSLLLAGLLKTKPSSPDVHGADVLKLALC